MGFPACLFTFDCVCVTLFALLYGYLRTSLIPDALLVCLVFVYGSLVYVTLFALSCSSLITFLDSLIVCFYFCACACVCVCVFVLSCRVFMFVAALLCTCFSCVD